MLAWPPTISDKALAAVDGEWRTAREIFARIDEGAPVTVKTTLVRLAEAGLVERRYDPHRNQEIARYRRVEADGVTAELSPKALTE
jgi:predicted transcriptional regulator